LDIVNGAPFVLQDIEANTAREVDVGVVDWRFEEYGWRGEGICTREFEGELEAETCIWSAIWPINRRSPFHEVLIIRKGGYARGGRHHERHQFCLQARGHFRLI